VNVDILYVFGAMAAYARAFGIVLAAISFTYDRDPQDKKH
jgi:hypothetical protein